MNLGIYPPNPSTDVGQFRYSLPDTNAVEVEPGGWSYREVSDAEVESFLARGGGSVNRALGHYYQALAANAAKIAASISDYDLKIDDTKRANELRLIAKSYFDLADDEDTTAGGSDIFEVFSMVSEGSCCTPEAAPYPYCGCRGRNVLF